MQTPNELAEVGRNGRRLIWKLTYGLAAALLLIAALTYALVANFAANTAVAQSQAACNLYHDVANSPIPKTGTTTLGLHISAGARVAYIQAHCHLGPLNPADPRVVPYLPKGFK